MISFPDLTKDDIEVRVARVTENGSGSGVSLVLYKDARVDARLLDETVGKELWQCDFYECKGTLFCKVGIKAGDEWVWKSDAGSPSNMEAQKGEASDAFKRACFKWGIGRELYTCPELFVWQDEPGDAFKLEHKNGKPTTYDRFKVSQILVEDKKIVALSILNTRTGKYIYRWDGRN